MLEQVQGVPRVLICLARQVSSTWPCHGWDLPCWLPAPNIPGSYAILFFTASDFTFTTRYIHNRVLLLLWLSLFIWKDWCWSWNSNTLATWCEELTYSKRPWFWERLKAGGEGDDRGWDGWMASLTQGTWVWVDSCSWWWTGRPGILWFMGSQRVRHDWATELSWPDTYITSFWTSLLSLFPSHPSRLV